MKNENKSYLLGLLVGFGIGFFICGIFSLSQPDYKDGQIDAINGVIKYELQVQADGSTKWEKQDD